MRYALLLLGLLACQAPTASVPLAEEPDLVEYFPLSGHPIPSRLYPAWWAAMEACSGRTGDLTTLRWFTLTDPHATWFWSFGHPAGGTYRPDEHAIILVGVKITDERSVQHEMLHALLAPVRGHPSVFDTCGVRLGAIDTH